MPKATIIGHITNGEADASLICALCPVPLGIRLLGLQLSALVEEERGLEQLGFAL